jgi:hypothetical protein
MAELLELAVLAAVALVVPMLEEPMVQQTLAVAVAVVEA